jgi:hypothetical protein
MKHDASKILGEWSKKQSGTPWALQVRHKEHEEQPLSKKSHTHRDFFGFVALPSYEELKPHLQKVLQLGRERSPHLLMPISTKLPWKPYPSWVKQDDIRGRVNHVTPKILKMLDVVRWKLATLEGMYPKDNMP